MVAGYPLTEPILAAIIAIVLGIAIALAVRAWRRHRDDAALAGTS